MVGLVLALLAGLSYAFSNSFIRRGMSHSGESYSPLPINISIGTLFFTVVLFVSGNAGELSSISWLGIGALTAAGVIHFIIGRFLIFTGIRLIGTNKAIPISSSSILIAALIGVFFLEEPLTVPLGVAVLLIVGGVALISTSGESSVVRPVMPRGSLATGVLAAFGGALCWGLSPVLMKIGLREVSTPLVALFLTYISAFAIVGFSLFRISNRQRLRNLNRTALRYIITAGLIGSIGATMLRMTALDFSPVSVVEPLVGSAQNLFIFPVSFLINRKIESFGIKVVTGVIAIVIGIFLIF